MKHCLSCLIYYLRFVYRNVKISELISVPSYPLKPRTQAGKSINKTLFPGRNIYFDCPLGQLQHELDSEQLRPQNLVVEDNR